MSAVHRILVIDDDAVWRERLARALRARGHAVETAPDAAQALAVAASFRPERAVVDLRMPGASGLALLPELIAAAPGVRAIVLTGYGSIATALEAVRLGAVNVVQKPVDADEVLAAFDPELERKDDAPIETPSLARVEWEHIQRVLGDCDGNISLAARRLGMHRRSLQRKLQKRP